MPGEGYLPHCLKFSLANPVQEAFGRWVHATIKIVIKTTHVVTASRTQRARRGSPVCHFFTMSLVQDLHYPTQRGSPVCRCIAEFWMLDHLSHNSAACISGQRSPWVSGKPLLTLYRSYIIRTYSACTWKLHELSCSHYVLLQRLVSNLQDPLCLDQ